MLVISFASLLWIVTQSVIPHDLEVVWEKSIDNPHGFWVVGRGIGAGDLNGDGKQDIAVSWGFYDTLQQKWTGGVWMFSSNPLDTIPDISISTFTSSLLVMDINGDGIDDLIIGATGADKVSGFLGPLRNNQEEDFRMLGWMAGNGDLPSTSLGASLANAGDVNGDGYEDLIVGGPGVGDYGVYGGAYIYYGGPDFELGYHYPPDVILPGGHDGCDEAFAERVGGGGDFNKDGYDDVIIGAPNYGYGWPAPQGRVYIYLGGNPMDTVEDLVFTGEKIGYLLGLWGVDILSNASFEYASVVFGTPMWGNERGKVFVLFGNEEMDSIPDIEISGRFDKSRFCWGDIKSAGDADQDGRDDIVVGSPVEKRPVGNDTNVGAAYFYRGGNVIDNAFDAWLEGESTEEPGWKLAEAGDFDDDGRSEFLVSNYASYPINYVWLCKFTGVGVEEDRPANRGLSLELSAAVTSENVRFYYTNPSNEEVKLSIYDVTGSLVRRYDRLRGSGVEWDLRDEQGLSVSSGVYTARLETKQGAAAQRLVVLR